jgi:hypothetical protein
VVTVRLRDRVGIDERRQRQLARAMEFVLVGLLFIALEQRNVGGVVTAAVALGVTKLPALLESDYSMELDAGLTLWLTSAVFLHTIGVVGVPGIDAVPYRSVPGYDHVTHALSASVVAGVGYATVRAFDAHSEEVDLPHRFAFVFVLLFVLAFGVGWEILEFTIGQVTEALGIAVSGATQHGLEDTMMDIVFNTVGGVVVAAWGQAHLSDVVGELQRRLETRGAD